MAFYSPTNINHSAVHMAQDVRDKYITVDGMQAFQDMVNKFAMTDMESDTVKRVRRALAKALRKARELGITQIAGQIPNNQRHAEQGLRSAPYSKKSGVLGGNMTILRSHRNGNTSSRPIPPGKEAVWSDRTKQIYGYQGADAQFLLYWLTQGTQERVAGTGRARYRDGNASYGTGGHSTGRLDSKFDPRLVQILERVINNEFISDIDNLWRTIASETK